MKIRLVDSLLIAAVSTAAILISQGVSFARWSKYQTAGDAINYHAGLLVVAGIGMGLLARVIMILLRMIATLSNRVDELEGNPRE
jgi:hypothetical protein